MCRTYWTGALVILSIAACSDYAGPYDGGNGGGGGGSSTTVTVANDFFNPTPDTVAPGVVTFTWAANSHGHTLVWDSGPGTLPADAPLTTSGSRTVTLQAGVYEYHCSIHGARGSGMHGRIVVQ
jgi:plastocyanin